MKESKELIQITIALIPSIYLAIQWPNLTSEIPIHYDINGQVDRYGSKLELLLLILALPLLTYLILTLVPFIDPKKRLQYMGSKYTQIKYILVMFMSVISSYIVYTAGNPEAMKATVLYAFVGLLFMALGNYLKTIKENYFIGIRTPWTLENPEIWKATHILAGYLWIAGGLSIILIASVASPTTSLIGLLAISLIISILPIIYSYLLHSKTT